MQKITEFLISPHFLVSLVVVVCAAALWIILKKLVGRRLRLEHDADRLNGKKETYLRVSASIIKYAVFILTIVLVLQINGINVSSLITGLGIFSAVVGLALQDALKDVIMGMTILEDNFFMVGDVVKYNGVEGKVIAFTVKTTKLQDIRTGNILTISNRNISEIEKLSNWLHICIPTAYEEDAARVRGVLEEACSRIRALPDVEDCLLLGTEEFADSSIQYKLRIVCPPALMPGLRRAALGVIQEAFKENAITIPYQQVDIHNRA